MVGNKHAGASLQSLEKQEVLWIAFKKEGDPQGKPEVSRGSSRSWRRREALQGSRRYRIPLRVLMQKASAHHRWYRSQVLMQLERGPWAAASTTMVGLTPLWHFAPTKLLSRVTPGSRDVTMRNDLTFTSMVRWSVLRSSTTQKYALSRSDADRARPRWTSLFDLESGCQWSSV